MWCLCSMYGITMAVACLAQQCNRAGRVEQRDVQQALQCGKMHVHCQQVKQL
jgi:hypothetical protein